MKTGVDWSDVRWSDVVGIKALGTDSFGAFWISLTFQYADGHEAEVDLLPQRAPAAVKELTFRFPSISPGWYEEMLAQPWHVEMTLYPHEKESR